MEGSDDARDGKKETTEKGERPKVFALEFPGRSCIYDICS